MTKNLSQRLQRIEQYFNDRIEQPILLRLASRDLGMSPSTIQRTLRTGLGVGFHSALRRRRVELALKLLAENQDLKIEAVARSVGWKSRRTLYSAVQSVTGATLSQHRVRPSTDPQRPVFEGLPPG